MPVKIPTHKLQLALITYTAIREFYHDLHEAALHKSCAELYAGIPGNLLNSAGNCGKFVEVFYTLFLLLIMSDSIYFKARHYVHLAYTL